MALIFNYKLAWLPSDVGAGLVLSAMLAPVGIAYASASGLPGVCGLYATLAPLLAYAIFGPSRILVLGPDSALVGVILSVVPPLAANDSNYAVVLAGAMAIVAGVLCVAGGLAGFGFVTELLSKPIRCGYLNGIAVTIVVSQLPKLFGIKLSAAGPAQELWALAKALGDGRANAGAFLVGVGTLLVIVLVRRRLRLPGFLAGVVLATLAVVVFDLDRGFGVSVLGPIPGGFPRLSLPLVRFEDVGAIAAGGAAAALVAFADTSVLSRALAGRDQTVVNPNQEMLALGAANLAAGLFQGFPVSSSNSRTPVAASAGAKTQLTCLIGAAAVAALLLVSPPWLERTPEPALAAIVILSALALFDMTDLRRWFSVQPGEFWLSIVCLLAVAVFGPILGIAMAVAVALVQFVWDAWRPHFAVLGHIEGVHGYHDVARHPDAEQERGLVLFRWDAPLFFANAEFFRESALAAVEDAITPARWLIVTAEPVTSVDVTSADSLAVLHAELKARGVRLAFAELKGPVKDKFRRLGLMDLIGEENIYATVEAAVAACKAAKA